MSYLAIDIAILPEGPVNDLAIAANQTLVGPNSSDIALNHHNVLPHISLAMGSIHESELPVLQQQLAQALNGISPLTIDLPHHFELDIPGKGPITYFEVENSAALQRLHNAIMQHSYPPLERTATEEMLVMFEGEQLHRPTLDWIVGYPDNSAGAKFDPHITIGFGTIAPVEMPQQFTANSIAICQLGNCCTCRKVLGTVALQG